MVLLFILVGCIIVVIFQTASVGRVVPLAYKPDIMLILVVWASLRFAAAAGITVAFVGGILVDFMSGAPTGLFALVYCFTFVASSSANSTFEINSPLGRALVIFAATFVSGGVVVLTSLLAGPVSVGVHTLLSILVKSMITAVASFIVFPILDKSWAGYGRLVGER